MQVKVGDHVFVRSNTRDDYIGLLKEIDGPHAVTLDQCSWVAESGRYFSTFIRTGRAENMEIEPMGDGWTMSYSGIMPWPHPLPTERV